jgi:60 kDa SS-A/Ro ribonucleoprotein
MNKRLFNRRGIQRSVPASNTRNAAGGRAYDLGSEAALAQYAVTGTFQDTFYVGATDHLKKVEELAKGCKSQFIAKLAVYSREHGKMKDMPAYLLAVLAARGETDLIKRIFTRVCNNSKVLLVFARIMRSGATGRSSFGTSIKRLIQEWITSKNTKSLYLSSVGHSDPSMADLIKMVHPRPLSDRQSAMFSYLLDKECDTHLLPMDIQQFENLKRGNFSGKLPDIPFRALTNCDLSVAQWREIALNMPWNTLRQSLNLLSRRGVFEDRGVVRNLAVTLANRENVERYNAFPFELLATWKATQNNVPVEISNALQEAMEIATRNVPKLPGDTLIAVDMSGSMCGAPVTGRGNKPSIISVVECASLIACSLLRQNKTASLIGFDSERYPSYRSVGQSGGLPGVYVMSHLNPFDSVMTNVNKMNHSGGGTDVSLPFRYLLHHRQKVDNIILLSDYESWTSPYGGGKGAPTCAAWMEYSSRHKSAKLACVDLQPQDTTQVPDQRGRVINVGGWNDPMFRVLGDFFTRDTSINFVQMVEASVDV